MTQTLIALLLVAVAAAYATWRLMPAPWRRTLTLALAQRGWLRGHTAQSPANAPPSGDCGSACSRCSGCR